MEKFLRKKTLAAVVFLAAGLFAGRKAEAQQFALSTNVLDYANFCTLNAEASQSLSRHWTANIGLRYNPFIFKGNTEKQLQNKTRSLSLGTRFWPWHVYSGWWFSAKLQYQEYNSGGIVSAVTQEGDRLGGGLGLGYTYMLNPHLNLDFGVKAWCGSDWFHRYACQRCGLTLDVGRTFFLRPEELIIALSYVF